MRRRPRVPPATRPRSTRACDLDVPSRPPWFLQVSPAPAVVLTAGAEKQDKPDEDEEDALPGHPQRRGARPRELARTGLLWAHADRRLGRHSEHERAERSLGVDRHGVV